MRLRLALLLSSGVSILAACGGRAGEQGGLNEACNETPGASFGTVSYSCNAGLVCNDGRSPPTCEPPNANGAGAACGSDANCAQPLFCAPMVGGSKCHDVLQLGDPCPSGIGCAVDLVCLKGAGGSALCVAVDGGADAATSSDGAADGGGSKSDARDADAGAADAGAADAGGGLDGTPADSPAAPDATTDVVVVPDATNTDAPVEAGSPADAGADAEASPAGDAPLVSDAPAPAPDAPPDALPDASVEDARPDAPPDAPSDAAVEDAGPDASPDAPPDAAVADAPPDASVDADGGMPSTTYPAPHPPLPQLINAAGGPVLKTPNIYLVVYPGNTNQAALATYAQRVGASTYWPATTHEYGVGALSYAGTTVLTGETPPVAITSATIQTWMGQKIQSGAFGTPDPQGIYTIVYPATTMIQQPNPVNPIFGPVYSCTNFRGFHDNVAVTLTDASAATSFAYAVLATCTSSLDDLTEVMSHEWVEASTDPQLTATGVFSLSGGPNAAYYSVDSDHIVWNVLSSGGEAGDLCQPERPEAIYTPADVGNAVQRTWSNLLAAASHDPCAPDLAGLPFFDSAPVLTETVTFTSSLTGTITTKGVTIPVGQSKTIEVDLFSDSPTSGPWTVTADDLLNRDYASYGLTKTLSFQWDRTQGTNGDKLHLTITLTGASFLGGAHAFVITSTLGTRRFQWPGIVVE